MTVTLSTWLRIIWHRGLRLNSRKCQLFLSPWIDKDARADSDSVGGLLDIQVDCDTNPRTGESPGRVRGESVVSARRVRASGMAHRRKEILQ